MTSLKPLFIGLFLFVIAPAFAQNSNPVFLKWKLKPGEVITYKTIMKEIDTANSKMSFGFMDKLMGDSTKGNFQNILKEMRGMENDTNLVTLKENKKNTINIEMRLNKGNSVTENDTSKSGSELNSFQSLMNKMSGSAILRGAISENGEVESFYTARGQENLIAIFFQLPGKAVKIGDSWPLDVKWISMDANFVCDSSYKRDLVTVTEINNRNGETIVTLKYDIVEFVSGNYDSPIIKIPGETLMKFTYKATADFSIEKGRWIDYEGIKTNTSTGIMSVQATEKYELIPE